MAQLAGLVMLDPEDTAAKGLFFFGGIEGCRFRKPVVPGDVLVGGRQRAHAAQRNGMGGKPATSTMRCVPTYGVGWGAGWGVGWGLGGRLGGGAGCVHEQTATVKPAQRPAFPSPRLALPG